MDGGDCCMGEDNDGDDVILEGDVSGVVIGVVEVGYEIDGATMGVLWESTGIVDPSPCKFLSKGGSRISLFVGLEESLVLIQKDLYKSWIH
ncbi:hypothetical protein Tco_0891523 [Tanacetum coccineum]|uniref:Uncharacterized protein n=1 Tax=Tanacetum coccineum TaxID=301880 RepID=A0ABQ5C6I8_9ASTR